MHLTEMTILFGGRPASVDLVDHDGILSPSALRRIWIEELCIKREYISVEVPDLTTWQDGYSVETHSSLIAMFLDFTNRLDSRPDNQIVDLESWVRASRSGEFDDDAMEAWLDHTQDGSFSDFAQSYIGYFCSVEEFVEQLLEDHDVPEWLEYDAEATWENHLRRGYFEKDNYYFRMVS